LLPSTVFKVLGGDPVSRQIDSSMSAAPERPWLLADIGGTNARFGWLAEGAEAPSHVQTLAASDHPDPAAAAAAYLAAVARAQGAAYRAPRAAAWAVATALGGDRVAFTNSGWSFSRRELQATLALDVFVLLNDFEALALSLPRLAPAQVRPIGPARAGGGPESALAARAVIGPGTGLGVAGLVSAPGGAGSTRWLALPGEGGHATLSAADDFEAALLQAVRRRFAHVSAERLLSGIGLPVLHAAVAELLGTPATELAAHEIVARGLDGSDATCSRVIDVFSALLGSFAGNVALTLGARGGVYIGGGIVPRLGERFFESDFRRRFEAKGRFADYLAAIPTLLITDTLAALSGAAMALEQRGA
jgi:glucokinase